MGICCCCGDNESDKKHANETVVTVNGDGAIITQPTNKSANSSFKFNRSNEESDGFVNDAVEFDEVDLSERQMSVRSHDKDTSPTLQSKTENNVETVHVTSLMLDQLYDNQKEGNEIQQNEDTDDHLSREIIEDYIYDQNAITEASLEDAADKLDNEDPHRLNILNIKLDSEDHPRTDQGLISEPVPAPRSIPLSNSPLPWPLAQDCCTSSGSTTPEPIESTHEVPTCEVPTCEASTCEMPESPSPKPVPEISKSPFELGVNQMDIPLNFFTETASTSDKGVSSDRPSSPASDTEKAVHGYTQTNRMYGNFPSDSSSSDCDEPAEFELESPENTDRHQKKEDYLVLSNEETDKSNAG